MGNIFPENTRFITTGPFDEEMPNHYIIIKDYRWWNNHEMEIFNWMDQCLPRGRKHLKGMIIEIEQESDVSNFLLRWN